MSAVAHLPTPLPHDATSRRRTRDERRAYGCRPGDFPLKKLKKRRSDSIKNIIEISTLAKNLSRCALFIIVRFAALALYTGCCEGRVRSNRGTVRLGGSAGHVAADPAAIPLSRAGSACYASPRGRQRSSGGDSLGDRPARGSSALGRAFARAFDRRPTRGCRFRACSPLPTHNSFSPPRFTHPSLTLLRCAASQPYVRI